MCVRAVKGTVTLVGSENVEVVVRENLGIRVMIRGTDGKEQVWSMSVCIRTQSWGNRNGTHSWGGVVSWCST